MLGSVAAVICLRNIKLDKEPAGPPEPSIEGIRTNVQRALDGTAANITRTPVETTLGAIRSVRRPPELVANRKKFASLRIAPLETQVWSFTARVTEATVRSDKDLYLVVEENGVRGCVEIPAPEHCLGSPFEKEIAAVRDKIEREYHPRLGPSKINRIAKLTGVGFFGTAGKKENGARLQPLLKLEWLETSAGSK